MRNRDRVDLFGMISYTIVLLATITVVLSWMWDLRISSPIRGIVVIAISAFYWVYRRIENRGHDHDHDDDGPGARAVPLHPSIFEPGDIASRCAHPGPCDWTMPCSPDQWPAGPWFCRDHCHHGHGTDALGHCLDCDEGIGPEHKVAGDP